MRILLTGASSFTGYWFARALTAAGHDVIATTRRSIDAYEPLRRTRIDLLSSVCELVEGRPFGSDPFVDLVNGVGPFDVLCHHGAQVAGYRDPGFDVMRALEANTAHADRVLRACVTQGARAFVATGTVFEPDEGTGTEPLSAFSAYGLSKALTWQTLRFHGSRYPIAIGKFTVPNPFGPLEEPRMTTYLSRTWQAGRVAEVQTPEYVRDNIHVDLLAAAYCAFVTRCADAGTGVHRANPSGYIGSQADFVARVSRKLSTRLGWSCEFTLRSPQTRWDEPPVRVNTQPAAPAIGAWDEERAWDAMASWADSGASYVAKVDIAC